MSMQLPRKIILSRKGFDGGTGYVSSPILDGTLISMPIPDAAGTVAYKDLQLDGHSYGKLVIDLHAKRKSGKGQWSLLSDTDKAHLDPDLIHGLRVRQAGWRPAYGQCGKDATILNRRGVAKGDLFLFFGWFRQCALDKGVYRYLRHTPDLHIVFGYLQVGDIIELSRAPAPDWAKDHPHLHGTARKSDKGNTLYIAANDLVLPGVEGLPGAASFTKFRNALQLTAEGMTRSIWRLPQWFYPRAGVCFLSSHERKDRWRMEGNTCLLNSVARGQEFIVDTGCVPESIGWAAHLIKEGMRV